MELIIVSNLHKIFKVLIRKKGLKGSLASFFFRKYKKVEAVNNISFSVNRGELVGYIGPNGAGKSTTIKILSGILVPSGGNVYVNGIIPYEQRKKNAFNIGVVFGQRSQLYWDLPVEETFDLYKRMFKIDNAKYKKNVELFIDLLDMNDFFGTPVRQLSLGQKMKANIAIALLHEPAILYLDEPTIGLDVVAKNNIRKFIKEINKERQTTIILTTHDMHDIEQICNRIILIDKGQLLYDGKIESFKNKYEGNCILSVVFKQEDTVFTHPQLKVIKKEGNKNIILFDRKNITPGEAITFIARNFETTDLQYKEPEIEEIVRKIYEGKNEKQE
ncbi:MAG: ATP-binding cassette domain-containing protein [Spirochaetales bacterium]|nr:ATP-binding cassette domain-containing protein [Spirochaetales bacterium]